jgi:polysaccharide export outer membrane protein
MRTLVLHFVALFGLAALTLAHGEDSYRLQPGDVLTISVWKEADLTGDQLVRPDGGISMPLAGEITAAGRTADDVRASIEQGLRKYIPDPTVTVSVKQTLGNQIFVIGRVNHPGTFPLNRPVDIMQALSMAGGMTPFAARDQIHVLRRNNGRETAIAFHYQEVEHGHRLDQNILLQSGDTVVVP